MLEIKHIFRFYFLERKCVDNSIIDKMRIPFWFSEETFISYTEKNATEFHDPNEGMMRIMQDTENNWLRNYILNDHDIFCEVSHVGSSEWIPVDIYQQINGLVKI